MDEGMIYLYCASVSEGATALAEKLRELEVPVTRIGSRNTRFTPGENDLCVNWGSQAPPVRGRWLNLHTIKNKLQELQTLREGGVNVPDTYRGKRFRLPEGRWFGRRRRHREGNDLLHPPRLPHYYVRYVPTVREFRVHVVRDQIVRIALKVARDQHSHPIVRTGEGWRFSYGDPERQGMTDAIRQAAINAVRALGYDFGGVDVGVQADGTPVVFEVNSRPGVEGGTVRKYAKHFRRLARDRHIHEIAIKG